MSALIQATVPVLASLNLDESRDFYTRYLGFHVLLQASDYLIVVRDGAELHFWLCAQRHIAQNTSCYVRTGDCQALYQEFSQRGLVLDAPVSRSWGMKELYVIDAHGNLLKFGEQQVVSHPTFAEENC
ncbi:glyoxalase [Stutzerimonas stutzeri]|uniref:Bleomycin resistance protein n=1 Tax=Stutzerimonas stutzeri TaxID=316 RepID=A0A2S4AMG4_STUST|nr:VOC family protein [Stutzerimonas stutzeri]MCQ4262808.1 VOC family protein [Stutzerimonas stutzeri]POH82675.1 glyoxalase [Stutzerimonas stutzeri]